MTQEAAFTEFKNLLDKLEAGLSADDFTDVLTRMIPECEERLGVDGDDDFDDERKKTMTTPTEPIESWRLVLRNGLLPLLSDDAVYAIYFALANDRPELIQGMTMCPPAQLSRADQECKAGCLYAYSQWKSLGLTTVSEVEEHTMRLLYEIDERMGEPAASRLLIGWYDETPRDSMILALLPEFRAELERREAKEMEMSHDDSQTLLV